MDEVPRIKEWMKKNLKSENYTEIVRYYENKLLTYVKKANLSMVFWQEIFEMFEHDENSPLLKGTNTVIHVWKFENKTELLQRVLDKGYGVLLSGGWYLDVQIPNPNSTHYLMVDTWANFYNNEPFRDLNITEKQIPQFLGGEICQWGEAADDNSIDMFMWPRACAAAERLWSPREVNQTYNAARRIQVHRCRMLNRGIKATPIRPDHCTLNAPETQIIQTFPPWIIVFEVIVFSAIAAILVILLIVACRKQSTDYQSLNNNDKKLN